MLAIFHITNREETLSNEKLRNGIYIPQNKDILPFFCICTVQRQAKRSLTSNCSLEPIGHLSLSSGFNPILYSLYFSGSMLFPFLKLKYFLVLSIFRDLSVLLFFLLQHFFFMKNFCSFFQFKFGSCIAQVVFTMCARTCQIHCCIQDPVGYLTKQELNRLSSLSLNICPYFHMDPHNQSGCLQQPIILTLWITGIISSI